MNWTNIWLELSPSNIGYLITSFRSERSNISCHRKYWTFHYQSFHSTWFPGILADVGNRISLSLNFFEEKMHRNQILELSLPKSLKQSFLLTWWNSLILHSCKKFSCSSQSGFEPRKLFFRFLRPDLCSVLLISLTCNVKTVRFLKKKCFSRLANTTQKIPINLCLPGHKLYEQLCQVFTVLLSGTKNQTGVIRNNLQNKG